jgi:hypothetical protein
MKPLPVHPVAAGFPLIEGAEFDALVEDIRRHGQRQPAVTYKGQLIDGRNRQRGVQVLGRRLKTVEWDGRGSLADLVSSLNLRRRNLTPSQLAAAAVGTGRAVRGGSPPADARGQESRPYAKCCGG